MKNRFIAGLTLILCGVWFRGNPGVAADTASPPTKRIYCWQKGGPNGPIYADRNHDGKIDWEADGPGMMAEMSSRFKMDTNFDGYYDVEYTISTTIAGKETYWSTNIHERVPEVGKDFVLIEKPNWVHWPEPSIEKPPSQATTPGRPPARVQ